MKNNFFYITKFKSLILINKYILLTNNKNNEFIYFNINKNIINKIFKKINLYILNQKNYIIIFNNKNSFFKIERNSIINIIYNGFFINNYYNKKVCNYIFFFTLNFKIYINWIFKIIKTIKIIIFFLYKKLILSIFINKHINSF